MKILLVGNDKVMLEGRRMLLEKVFPDARYMTFQDPLLAVKHCMNHAADFVLSDFSLPMIDGIQLIKLLRSQNPAIVPVLIEKQEIHREDAENLGIGYLLEPFAAEEAAEIYGEREQPFWKD